VEVALWSLLVLSWLAALRRRALRVGGMTVGACAVAGSCSVIGSLPPHHDGGLPSRVGVLAARGGGKRSSATMPGLREFVKSCFIAPRRCLGLLWGVG